MAPLTTGALQKALQVTLEGRGDCTIRPADYVTSGGEGSIYKLSSSTIVKLYTDTHKLIHDGTADKIRLLATVQHPFIVAPKGLVLEKNKPIGYYMNFVDGEPFVRVFSNTFRQREKFTDKQTMQLVEGMRTVVETAHAHNALLIDANEYNWLMTKNKSVVEPRIIDVDSWAIGQWRPSVIMPSIRDWHTKGFTRESDWFSFAVVSFQLFTGIHPYKGGLQGYGPGDMEARMKANASVFTQGIRLNSAVRDFNAIPQQLLSWYEAVFQHGERSLPPLAAGQRAVLSIQKAVITSSGALLFEVLFDGAADAPLEVYPCGIVRLASGALYMLSNKRIVQRPETISTEIIQTEHGFLLAEQTISGTSFSLLRKDGSTTALASVLNARKFFRYENRLFIVTDGGLVEVTVKDFGKPLLVPQNTWQVLLNSTTWYQGIAIQQSLGATHMILPFGEKSCTYVFTSDLKGMKIVDAVAGVRTAIVIALDPASGQYYRYSYVFNHEYTQHTVEKSVVSMPDLNMVCLPKGVCVNIINDGELHIAVPTKGTTTVVNDPHIKTSFVLSHWDNTVTFIANKKVWKVAMK